MARRTTTPQDSIREPKRQCRLSLSGTAFAALRQAATADGLGISAWVTAQMLGFPASGRMQPRRYQRPAPEVLEAIDGLRLLVALLGRLARVLPQRGTQGSERTEAVLEALLTSADLCRRAALRLMGASGTSGDLATDRERIADLMEIHRSLVDASAAPAAGGEFNGDDRQGVQRSFHRPSQGLGF